MIVGGGLFPRTALVLGRRLPESHLVVLEASATHARLAERALVKRRSLARVDFVVARFGPAPHDLETLSRDADLVVVPLALVGEEPSYGSCRCPVLVHDWIWKRRGAAGRVVSPWLLKRINLMLPRPRVEAA